MVKGKLGKAIVAVAAKIIVKVLDWMGKEPRGKKPTPMGPPSH